MALSAPTTNATGATVALGAASVTTTIIDNDTQTFSLTEGSTTVTEGSADSYTVHLSNPIDPGVTVSVHIAITLPGGLGGAEAADFTHAFLADVATAVGLRTGVSFDAATGTLTFNSAFDTTTPLQLHPADRQRHPGGGQRELQPWRCQRRPPTRPAPAFALGAASVTTTIIDNDPAAGAITLQVDEAALSIGSNPASLAEIANSPLSFTAAGFNLVSFAFSSDISGLIKDLNNDGSQDIFWVRDSGTQISGYLDAAHTQLADRLTLSPPAAGIAAGATGSVTVTETLSAALKNPTDNGSQVSSLGNVGLVATDTNGDTATGTVNLAVKDDVPTATPASNSGQAVSPDTNLLITLDLSGSMGNSSGVGGLTKLQLAEQAILNLMQQYDTLGHVKVELVTFSDTARDASGGWVDLSDPAAKANLTNIILGLSAGGGTNYDAALTLDRTDYASSRQTYGFKRSECGLLPVRWSTDLWR